MKFSESEVIVTFAKSGVESFQFIGETVGGGEKILE
jgi:hypothetical protein